MAEVHMKIIFYGTMEAISRAQLLIECPNFLKNKLLSITLPDNEGDLASPNPTLIQYVKPTVQSFGHLQHSRIKIEVHNGDYTQKKTGANSATMYIKIPLQTLRLRSVSIWRQFQIGNTKFGFKFSIRILKNVCD